MVKPDGVKCRLFGGLVGKITRGDNVYNTLVVRVKR